MLRQALDLPGVNNARELGGYAIGRRRVREGVLLRTGDLGHAEEVAIGRLHDVYHVQIVVDLRMSVERDILADPEIPGASNHHVKIIEMEDFRIPADMDPSKMEAFRDPTANRLELFEISCETGMIGPDLYVDFLTGERGMRGYAEFFRLLLEVEEGRAMLWHCTDGKDRTGCAAMLVLSALGADRQTVMGDFLLTNAYNAARIEAAMRMVEVASMSDERLKLFRVLLGAVEGSYMERAMDLLEERYGGVLGYLREELGVDEADLSELRDKFLV